MRNARAIATVSAAIAITLVSASCTATDGAATGDTTKPTTEPQITADDKFTNLAGQSTVVVQARDNTFAEQFIVVSPGTTITFDNRGRNPHNVIPVKDGAFSEIGVDALGPGAEKALTFNDPGEYKYYCSLHGTKKAGMVGTIVVESTGR